MKKSINSLSFVNYWFDIFKTKYREKFRDPVSKRQRNITKSYFATLSGFKNFTELNSAWEQIEDKYSFQKIHLKECNEKVLALFTQALVDFSEPDASFTEKLLLDAALGHVPQADLDFYLSAQAHEAKEAPTSLVNQMRKYYDSERILDLAELPKFDKRVITLRLFNYLSSPAKLRMFSFGVSRSSITDEQYSILLRDFFDLMESGELFDTTWHNEEVKKSTYWYDRGNKDLPENNVRRQEMPFEIVIGDALNRGLLTINELLNKLKAHSLNVDASEASRPTSIYKLAKDYNFGNVAAIKLLLKLQSDHLDKQSIKALTFFCNNLHIPTIEHKNTESLSFWGTSNKQDKKDDISEILNNESELAAPVLATFMLYNLAEMDFSIERMFACLYVISRNPVLRPLCEDLEVIQRINKTLRYSDNDLLNPLAAAFILISKAKQFGNSKEATASYYTFLNDLYRANQWELLLIESSRYIEKTQFNFEIPTFKNYIQKALSKMSLKSIEELDVRVKNAAFLTAARHGELLVDTLANHVSKDVLRASEAIRNPSYATIKGDGRHEKTALLNDVKQISKNRIMNAQLLGMSNNQYFSEGIIETLIVTKAAIETVKVREEFKRKLKWASDHPNLSRRHNQYRMNNLISNYIPQELKVFMRYVDEYDVSAYELYRLKQETNLRKSDIIMQDRESICCLSNERIVVCGYITQSEFVSLIKSHKPKEMLFIQYDGNIRGNYKDDLPYIADGDDQLLKLPNVDGNELEFLDEYSWVTNFLSTLNLEGINPLEKTVKSLAPMYGFEGIIINPDGKDYTAV